jgi:hypothetical protein
MQLRAETGQLAGERVEAWTLHRSGQLGFVFDTTSLRRSSSSFGMSILTGQTSPHAPHKLEA